VNFDKLPELNELKRSFDQSVFHKSTFKSLFYFFFDCAAITLLSIISYSLVNNGLWPLALISAALSGSFFWSLFVVGHDCGHGSFSSSKSLNYLVGYISHHFLLVPYYGWAMSHKKHHTFHGNLEFDESHVPITFQRWMIVVQNRENRLGVFLAKTYKFLMYVTGAIYFSYLWMSYQAKDNAFTSHYIPSKYLKTDRNKLDVYAGLVGYLAALIAVGVSFYYNPMVTLFLYILPLVVCYHLLVMVTYMQHHFPESKWFYNENWNYLKGAMTSMDHYYSNRLLDRAVSFFWHRISTDHIVHHIFTDIPHYNLIKATEEMNKNIGEFTEKKRLFSYRNYFNFLWTLDFVEDKNDDNKYETFTVKKL